MGDPKSISVVLSSDEALVLFEYLASKSSMPAPDSAEQRVLWDLEALLEKQLVEPFLPDYKERVEAARRRVLGT